MATEATSLQQDMCCRPYSPPTASNSHAARTALPNSRTAGGAALHWLPACSAAHISCFLALCPAQCDRSQCRHLLNSSAPQSTHLHSTPCHKSQLTAAAPLKCTQRKSGCVLATEIANILNQAGDRRAGELEGSRPLAACCCRQHAWRFIHCGECQ